MIKMAQTFNKIACFVVAISAFLFGSLCAAAAEPVRIGGNGTVSAIMVRLGERFEQANPGAAVKVLLPPVGSSGGLRGLSTGKLDIAVGIRPLKPEEQAAPNIGESRQLGRTDFILVTSRPVADPIDVDVLARIYTGAITHWPDGTPVRLILRSRAETVTHFLRGLSPEMNKAIDASFERKGMVVAENDLEATELAERTPGALAPSTLALTKLESRGLKIVPIVGVKPGRGDDAAAPYLRLWLTVTAAPSPETLAFLAFLDQPETRRYLNGLGIVTDDR